MYYFEGPDIRFELIFCKCYEEEYKIGNPYNTNILINIYSYGYCGKSEWTIDFCELNEFSYKLKKIYINLNGELEFKDKEYCSELKIKCNNLGQFNFIGNLNSFTFQKLHFDFSLDQTFLNDFVEELYNDFGKNFVDKKK